MSRTNEKEWFMRRTTLITAAAIAGVALAGAAAITANVGILSAAETSEIGTLSAANDLVPTEPTVIDVYLDPTTTVASVVERAPAAAAATAGSPAAPSTPPAAPAGSAAATSSGSSGSSGNSAPNAESQTFSVAGAGSVTVGRTPAGIALAGAVAQDGWTWRQTRTEASALGVTFSSGARTLVFTATLGPDGAIVGAVVDASVPAAAPQPTPAAPVVAGDDDHDEDEYEHEDEDEDHEEAEHEGGEDDD